MTGRQLLWLFFGLRGRISAAAYLLGGLFLYMTISFTFYRLYLAMGIDPESAATQNWSLIFVIALLLGNWSFFTLTVKRFHDFGRSAIWALSAFIAGFLLLLVLPFIRSDPGPNRFGSEPNRPA